MTETRTLTTEVRQDDDLAENEFVALATTPTEDRHGTRIDPDGIDLKSFMANPVLLLSHNSDSLPIGQVTSLRRTPDGIEARFEIDGVTELERTVIEKLNAGSLRGVSIGFLPKEEERADDGVIEIVESELIELSVVAIPSNSSTVVTERALKDHYQRKGAVLSRQNKQDLREIRDLAERILSRASDEDEDKANKDAPAHDAREDDDKDERDLVERVRDLEERLAAIEGDWCTQNFRDESNDESGDEREIPDVVTDLADRLNI